MSETKLTTTPSTETKSSSSSAAAATSSSIITTKQDETNKNENNNNIDSKISSTLAKCDSLLKDDSLDVAWKRFQDSFKKMNTLFADKLLQMIPLSDLLPPDEVPKWCSWHGRLGNPYWLPPRCVAETTRLSRPGYSDITASEYIDHPQVLEEKINILCLMLRLCHNTVCYTGAGISCAAGIRDYASTAENSTAFSSSSATSSANKNEGKPQKLTKELIQKALPTFSHRCIVSLMKTINPTNNNKTTATTSSKKQENQKENQKEEEKNYYCRFFLNQNHDGLALRAGAPQEKCCAIHGEIHDPHNPIVKMSGSLRPDLVQMMNCWKKKADFVLAIGSSLSGMASDNVGKECARRFCESSKSMFQLTADPKKDEEATEVKKKSSASAAAAASSAASTTKSTTTKPTTKAKSPPVQRSINQRPLPRSPPKVAVAAAAGSNKSTSNQQQRKSPTTRTTSSVTTTNKTPKRSTSCVNLCTRKQGSAPATLSSFSSISSSSSSTSKATTTNSKQQQQTQTTAPITFRPHPLSEEKLSEIIKFCSAGMCIIAIQQTKLDYISSLRIYAKIDDVMKKVQQKLKLVIDEKTYPLPTEKFLEYIPADGVRIPDDRPSMQQKNKEEQEKSSAIAKIMKNKTEQEKSAILSKITSKIKASKK